jgi:hypothetical protein
MRQLTSSSEAVVRHHWALWKLPEDVLVGLLGMDAETHHVQWSWRQALLDCLLSQGKQLGNGLVAGDLLLQDMLQVVLQIALLLGCLVESHHHHLVSLLEAHALFGLELCQPCCQLLLVPGSRRRLPEALDRLGQILLGHGGHRRQQLVRWALHGLECCEKLKIRSHLKTLVA